MDRVIVLLISAIVAAILVPLLTNRMKLLRLRFLAIRKNWKREIEKNDMVDEVEWTSEGPVVLYDGKFPLLFKQLIAHWTGEVRVENRPSEISIHCTGYGVALPDKSRGWEPTGAFFPETFSPDAALSEWQAVAQDDKKEGES